MGVRFDGYGAGFLLAGAAVGGRGRWHGLVLRGF
jgi:hypothetical protein